MSFSLTMNWLHCKTNCQPHGSITLTGSLSTWHPVGGNTKIIPQQFAVGLLPIRRKIISKRTTVITVWMRGKLYE